MTVKTKSSIIFVVLLLIATVYGGAFIQYFQGKSESDNIKLEWQTGEENNLQKFVIERKTPQSSFAEIGIVTPKGSNSYYSFIDQNTYKTNDLIFIYRLKIVDNNGQVTYSNETTVSHSISGVKRTWGSIKAMFR
ncbi:MAG TPA: hypothetical protein PK073_10730 [Ignavibacteriaceae bacterium]|nr:MAG: hypothetical protein BWY38_02658 [Ignavibacteria bacterium ADurb.Bin266]HQF43375.1 hypothetical protein [Ignavibacteriaceae bacterium]HQI42355.1 hypothetical protein [Ignavibacteriaceae bacterium]